jgi:hypothetical protein
MRKVSYRHFHSQDFQNVYEPGDDTFLFLDVLEEEFKSEMVSNSELLPRIQLVYFVLRSVPAAVS